MKAKAEILNAYLSGAADSARRAKEWLALSATMRASSVVRIVYIIWAMQDLVIAEKCLIKAVAYEEANDD